MLLAKAFPGRMDVPMVSGLSVLSTPTMTSTTQFRIDDAGSKPPGNSVTTPVALGSVDEYPYVVLFYCPALTHMYA